MDYVYYVFAKFCWILYNYFEESFPSQIQLGLGAGSLSPTELEVMTFLADESLIFAPIT
jgi:hypothetical protein